MTLFSKIGKFLALRYRRNVLRDPFLLEAARWFRDNGDETLRLDYPLTGESLVFDVGGYHGDFAAAIYEKYRCQICIFEPVPEFYEKCVVRFRGNNKITCLNFGLASSDGSLDIGLAENASSFSLPDRNAPTHRAQVRSIAKFIGDLRVERIDLVKINIEGGEFDVIPALIDSGHIKIVGHLQVQFHNFIEAAVQKRSSIRTLLGVTHSQMWNYEFIWESWKLKEPEF